MIGIISDTHDNTDAIKKAVKIFNENKVDVVIHCGDLVCPLSLAYFKGLNIFIVRGNCDGEIAGIKARSDEIGAHFFDNLGEVQLNDKVIAFTHGNDEIVLSKLIKSGRFDYVFHGHTHMKRDEHIGKTRVINPGALFMPVEEKSIALLDIDNDKLRFVEVK